jgi:hypothetical protein
MSNIVKPLRWGLVGQRTKDITRHFTRSRTDTSPYKPLGGLGHRDLRIHILSIDTRGSRRRSLGTLPLSFLVWLIFCYPSCIGEFVQVSNNDAVELWCGFSIEFVQGDGAVPVVEIKIAQSAQRTCSVGLRSLLT